MTKPPLASTIASLLTITIITPVLVTPTWALAGRVVAYQSSTVELREEARRRDYEIRGESAIELGERAMKEKDYETAVAQFKLACDLIPNAPEYCASFTKKRLRVFARPASSLRSSGSLKAVMPMQKISANRCSQKTTIRSISQRLYYFPASKRLDISTERLARNSVAR